MGCMFCLQVAGVSPLFAYVCSACCFCLRAFARQLRVFVLCAFFAVIAYGLLRVFVHQLCVLWRQLCAPARWLCVFAHQLHVFAWLLL